MPAAKRQRTPASHAIVDAQREGYCMGLMESPRLWVPDICEGFKMAEERYPYPKKPDTRSVATAMTAVYREVIKTVGAPTGIVTYVLPLLKEHTLEQVLAWWRQYLEANVKTPQYISARVFASKPDKWAPATPTGVGALARQHFTIGQLEEDGR